MPPPPPRCPPRPRRGPAGRPLRAHPGTRSAGPGPGGRLVCRPSPWRRPRPGPGRSGRRWRGLGGWRTEGEVGWRFREREVGGGEAEGQRVFLVGEDAWRSCGQEPPLKTPCPHIPGQAWVSKHQRARRARSRVPGWTRRGPGKKRSADSPPRPCPSLTSSPLTLSLSAHAPRPIASTMPMKPRESAIVWCALKACWGVGVGVLGEEGWCGDVHVFLLAPSECGILLNSSQDPPPPPLLVLFVSHVKSFLHSTHKERRSRCGGRLSGRPGTRSCAKNPVRPRNHGGTPHPGAGPPQTRTHTHTHTLRSPRPAPVDQFSKESSLLVIVGPRQVARARAPLDPGRGEGRARAGSRQAG